jgi:hypothetical protein
MGGLDLDRAKKELKLADHMLYVTMSVVADEKLFLSIVNHLVNSVVEVVSKYLEREAMYKRIEMLPKGTKARLELFKRRYVSKLGLNRKTVEMLDHLLSANEAKVNAHSKFAKKDKFVIISRNYQVHIIDKASIKRYISLQKELINRIEGDTVGE